MHGFSDIIHWKQQNSGIKTVKVVDLQLLLFNSYTRTWHEQLIRYLIDCPPSNRRPSNWTFHRALKRPRHTIILRNLVTFCPMFTFTVGGPETGWRNRRCSETTWRLAWLCIWKIFRHTNLKSSLHIVIESGSKASSVVCCTPLNIGTSLKAFEFRGSLMDGCNPSTNNNVERL